MTFERLNRAGRSGGPLWCMPICDRGTRFGRQLVMELNTSPNPDLGAQMEVWVEDSQARYHWISTDPSKCPPVPTFSIDHVEVEGTRRRDTPRNSLEYLVIKALARGELHGESAASCVHNLFWMHFVEDDDGLHYLYRHADKETGGFYARERLLRYVRYNELPGDRHYRIRSAIEDAMKDHDATLGERFCRTALADPAIRDAIAALRMTNEPEAVQLENVRKLVELNATAMDRAITLIVDETRVGHALLGVRACQRAENDPEFFALLTAHITARPDGRGLISFLRTHCKRPKSVKPEKRTDVEEAYDD